ncbi:MAG: ATP-binding cassette domain-containing protein [Capsulimonadales bacterium]|nr:ATP-binding cassette domain-containing protein [Capsulimonadales bacterium]
MPLIETLPDAVESALKSARNGHDEEPIHAAVRTDIGSDGRLGERWVVVDGQSVRVLSPNGGGPAYVDLHLPLSELNGSQTENLVGGGVLIARQGSALHEVARFTSARAGRMASVARVIDALAHGKDLPTIDEDEERLCKNCGRPLPKDSDVCRYCINKSATLRRLLSYAFPYRWQAVALVVLMFLGTATGLVPGLIIKQMTDNVFLAGPTVPLGQRYTWLGGWIAALIGAQLVGTVITVIRGRLSAYLSGVITLTLREQVFGQLQKLGLSYYDKRQSGALMARVTHDVGELNNFLVDGLQFIVVNGLTMIGILVVLLTQDWRLTLYVLIPVPAVIFFTHFTWKFVWQRLERMWQIRSSMHAVLNSVLNGVRVVKAFAQEGREVDAFHRRSFAMFDSQVRVEQTFSTVFPFLGFVMTSGSFVVYALGGRQVIAGAITFGTLNLFLYYLGQLYGPLHGMTRIADWLSRALTAAERVFEVIDTEPDVKDNEDSVPMERIEGAVRFENVAFSYDKARRVLEEFNLDVKPGEMIGLVGHSGAGKSTIINLIARFYDPTEGRILIDGVEMRKIRVTDLRRQLGIVLQEPFLFPGTIAENIAYANPGATPEEIMRAAKAANAHDFIMRFPDGYDSQVGERGTRLSGGERQRISIARAILHNPRILILDEATASVDTETEKQIQEAIQRLIRGRTTFAIAHRLSTLRNADRLVVMDKGKIAEMGTHEELMAKEDGTFRKLVDMQTEINKLRAY